MDKKLTFNYVKDIENIQHRYPKHPDYVAGFKSVDDSTHYIYALCTKRDFSVPDLFEVDAETYESIRKFFAETFDAALVENVVNNVSDVFMMIDLGQQKYLLESRTIGEMLNLD